MTAVGLSARPRLRPLLPGCRAAWRLLRIEFRHNAMVWMVPVVFGLFWFITLRKTLAMPPFWDIRAGNLQTYSVIDFATPVVGAAAWMASRESRRRTADLVSTSAQPRAARLIATWAATTGWALAAYLVCLAVAYGMIARHAAWGGPLWWPAAVAATSLPALVALGFAIGTLLPSRFTAPIVAVAAFFVLALSTELIVGSQSYWQISPIVTGPWDISEGDPGVATFYPYLPDLAIAQVMFLAGLTVAVMGGLVWSVGSYGRALRAVAAALTAAGMVAAGTAVALVGTGTLSSHGMIAIPALHDAANDRPLRFTPVCSHAAAIPVCVNPAYVSDLSATTAALAPVLSEIAGLPGAPVEIMQTAPTYTQGTGNDVSIGLSGPVISGTPPTYRMLLPNQLGGPPLTSAELAEQLRSNVGVTLIAALIGDGPGSSPAQRVVVAALMKEAGVSAQVELGPMGRRHGRISSAAEGIVHSPSKGSAVYLASERFEALSASVRHAWLVQHLQALRAGRITLAQLP